MFFWFGKTRTNRTFAASKEQTMNKKALNQQKSVLIEQLGVQLECDNLAPLAARIFATLILTGKQGITFEQLVCDLNASKSTVSSHLESLQTSQKVKYITKPGDRKRYFIINPNLMVNVIDEMTSKWETEKELHQKVLQYKKEFNQTTQEKELQFDLEFQQDFLTFLEEATSAIQKLKSKIQQKHLTNYNS